MADTKQTKKKEQASKQEASAQSPQQSIWEWIVAGVGVLLVAGTLIFLIYDSFLGTSPPNISVEPTNIQKLGDRYLVQFQVINKGGEGAAGVNIEGELTGAEGQVESAQATISYIAAGSRQEGGLYFSQDPSALELKLFAVGYEEP